jgi:hypothetical protein
VGPGREGLRGLDHRGPGRGSYRVSGSGPGRAGAAAQPGMAGDITGRRPWRPGNRSVPSTPTRSVTVHSERVFCREGLQGIPRCNPGRTRCSVCMPRSNALRRRHHSVRMSRTQISYSESMGDMALFEEYKTKEGGRAVRALGNI